MVERLKIHNWAFLLVCTAITFDILRPGYAQQTVTIDAVSSFGGGESGTFIFSHRVKNGNLRKLIVGVSLLAGPSDKKFRA